MALRSSSGADVRARPLGLAGEDALRDQAVERLHRDAELAPELGGVVGAVDRLRLPLALLVLRGGSRRA